MRFPSASAIWSLVLAASAAPAAALPGYLRHPDLHGGQVVFAAEADLWLASDRGGTARRLTTHAGSEYFPRFSPDGAAIAFTGEYDGNQDVYVVGADGGEPHRLTWHPGADEVIGWTPDGARILYRTRAYEPHGSHELYAIPAAGGDPEKLPLGWAARLDIDPATGLWAFNRISRESHTWKRYRGGTEQDIWVGNPERADFKRVTEFKGTDAFPMWHGGRIYFLSDQGGTANLWSMESDGSDRRRHTDFGSWDARWPSMGSDGRIAFTLAGDIHIFDPATGAERKLELDLGSERILTRVRYPDPARHLTWFALAPRGDRVAIVSRGEIFSVPAKKDGVTLPVTRGSGARESWAIYDPKGERLAYVSDATHEEGIYTIDAWGRGAPATVTPAGANPGWHFPPAWSPDGKWIAYADQTHTLWVAPTWLAGSPGSSRRLSAGRSASPLLAPPRPQL